LKRARIVPEEGGKHTGKTFPEEENSRPGEKGEEGDRTRKKKKNGSFGNGEKTERKKRTKDLGRS